MNRSTTNRRVFRALAASRPLSDQAYHLPYWLHPALQHEPVIRTSDCRYPRTPLVRTAEASVGRYLQYLPVRWSARMEAWPR